MVGTRACVTIATAFPTSLLPLLLLPLLLLLRCARTVCGTACPVVPEPNPLTGMSQVSEHSSAKSLWMIIDDNVYDVTKFLVEVRLLAYSIG